MEQLPLTLGIDVEVNPFNCLVFSVAVENVSDDPVKCKRSSGKIIDVKARDAPDNVVWTPDLMYTQDVSHFSMDPGQVIERKFTWRTPEEARKDMPDRFDIDHHPDPHEFDEITIEATFICQPNDYSRVSVTKTVTVPDPEQ